jgi:serine/threonine protein kinase
MRKIGVFFVFFCLYATGVFADNLGKVCLEFFKFISQNQPIDHDFLKLIQKKIEKGERIKFLSGGEARVAPIDYNGEIYFIKIPQNHEKYRFNTEAPEWKIEEVRQWAALQNLAAKHNLAPPITLYEHPETPPILISKQIKGTTTLEEFIENKYKKLEFNGGLKLQDREIWLKNFHRNLVQKTYQLHQLGIDHGDLKPKNILVNEEGDVFFIDFGSAKALSNKADPFQDFKAIEAKYQRAFLANQDVYLLHTPRYANGRLIDFKAGASDAHAVTVILKDILNKENPNDFYIKVHPAEDQSENGKPEVLPIPVGLWHFPANFYQERPYLKALMLAAEFGVSKKQSYEEAHQIHQASLSPEHWDKAINKVAPSEKDLSDFENLVTKAQPIDQLMILYGDKKNPILDALKKKIFFDTEEGRKTLVRLKNELDKLDIFNQTLGEEHVFVGNASSHFVDKKSLQQDLLKASLYEPEIRIAPSTQPKNKSEPKFNISRWALAAGVLGGTTLAGIGGYQYLTPNNNHAANTNNDDDRKKRKPATDAITQAAQTLSHIASDLEKVMNDIEKIEDKKEEPQKEPKAEKPAPEKQIERKPDTVAVVKQDCTCRPEWSEWVDNKQTRECVIRDKNKNVVARQARIGNDFRCYNSCSPESPYVDALAKQDKVKQFCKSIERLDPIDSPITKASAL